MDCLEYGDNLIGQVDFNKVSIELAIDSAEDDPEKSVKELVSVIQNHVDYAEEQFWWRRYAAKVKFQAGVRFDCLSESVADMAQIIFRHVNRANEALFRLLTSKEETFDGELISHLIAFSKKVDSLSNAVFTEHIKSSLMMATRHYLHYMKKEIDDNREELRFLREQRSKVPLWLQDTFLIRQSSLEWHIHNDPERALKTLEEVCNKLGVEYQCQKGALFAAFRRLRGCCKML